MTEGAIIALYPMGWRVSRTVHKQNRVVHGWARAGSWYVLAGTATCNGTAIGAGEIIVLETGNYKIAVGADDLVMMCVWRLPSNTPNN